MHTYAIFSFAISFCLDRFAKVRKICVKRGLYPFFILMKRVIYKKVLTLWNHTSIIMKKLWISLLCLVSISAVAQVSFGTSEKFNEGWRFVLDDDSAAISPDYDDSRWRELTLPHDWSVESAPSQALASCTGYLPGGIGW